MSNTTIEKTCARCSGDCHNQNIHNFAASTRWRDRADALASGLLEVRTTLLRWASESEAVHRDTEKVEFHYCAQNYRAEAEKITALIGPANDAQGV